MTSRKPTLTSSRTSSSAPARLPPCCGSAPTTWASCPPRPPGGVLRAQQLTAAVAVGYGPETLVTPVAEGLRDAAGRAAIDLHEFLRVAGGRYWSYVCGNEAVCPAAGGPFDAAAVPFDAAADPAAAAALPDSAAALAD